MPAYLIAEVDVHDPKAYEGYRPLAAAAIARYGGRYLVRGGTTETLEGGWQPQRLVVLEFDDMAAVRRFYNSPEYREAMKLRHAAAKSRLLIAEGYVP